MRLSYGMIHVFMAAYRDAKSEIAKLTVVQKCRKRAAEDEIHNFWHMCTIGNLQLEDV